MNAPNLHVYVINLSAATRRWEHIRTTLESLGISFSRIEAIHGDNLTEPIEGYSKPRYTVLTGKVTNRREIGCYLSHMKALHEFLTSKHAYALILEDDVVLTEQIKPVLEGILAHGDRWDMVRLSSSRQGNYLPFAELPGGFKLAYNTRVLKNTGAYVVNRHAAQCCVTKMQPMRLPYDVALDRDWDFGFRTACVVPFPVALNEDLPSQIPRAKRIRIFRSTTFHLFHLLTHIERWFHRNRYFREAKKAKRETQPANFSA